VLLIEYALRPLYIFQSGFIGWDFTVERPYGHLSNSIGRSAIGGTAAVFLFAVAYVLLSERPTLSGRIDEIRDRVREASSRTHSYRFGLVLPLGFALFAFIAARRLAGGGTVGTGSFGRQSFGSGYLYISMNIGMAILLAVVASIVSRNGYLRRNQLAGVAAFAVVFSAAHLLYTGGRTEVITLWIGLFALLVLLNPARSLLKACFGLAGFLVAFAAYRVTTREVFYDVGSGDSALDLLAESASDPLGLLLRGDVSSFDKLAFIDFLDPERLWGATYAATLYVPIPGTNPDGGNRAFTEIAAPGRYANSPTSEGASFFGEALMNFGWGGVAVAAILLGCVTAIIDRRARAGVDGSLFVWAMWMGSFPTLLRADLLNYSASYGGLFVAGIVWNRLVNNSSGIVLPSGLQAGHRWPADQGGVYG
jgi:oligosaccharide repeat unit polymerase